MKNTSILLLSLTASTAFAASQAPSFDSQRLSQHVKVLASDAFEGRGPNTAGEEKTIAYLIEQFKAAGMQPGGDLKDGKRLWTQAVPLGRFEIEGPVAASVSLGGKPQALQQGEQLAIRDQHQRCAAGVRGLRRDRPRA